MAASSDREILRRAAVERYAALDDKIFMTLEESILLSEELAERLGDLDSKPECVVGIANGALLMATVIAQQLGVPMISLTIRRKGSVLKQSLARIPGLRRTVSYLYGLTAFRPLLARGMRRFEALEQEGATESELPVRGLRVALVDDCIESGQTIARAMQLLESAGATGVATCCISWSRLKDSWSEHQVRPDLYIGRRVQHYPWSGNSPYLAEFSSWLAGHGVTQVRK